MKNNLKKCNRIIRHGSFEIHCQKKAVESIIFEDKEYLLCQDCYEELCGQVFDVVIEEAEFLEADWRYN